MTIPSLSYDEVLKQEYSKNNCVFSAGFVEGHPVDTMYIRLEREGEEPTIILLRPDEMASIAWLASGVLWSNEMRLITCKTCGGKGYLMGSMGKYVCYACKGK